MKGSCLCGSVTYEVDRLAGPIGHCHCRTCRKAHAAAFTSTARVFRSEFRWLSGESKLRSFESSKGKLRRFCSQCGTHLVADYPAQSQVILRIGTLDEDPGHRPAAHIWMSHHDAWLDYATDMKVFPEGAPKS